MIAERRVLPIRPLLRLAHSYARIAYSRRGRTPSHTLCFPMCAYIEITTNNTLRTLAPTAPPPAGTRRGQRTAAAPTGPRRARRDPYRGAQPLRGAARSQALR